MTLPYFCMNLFYFLAVFFLTKWTVYNLQQYSQSLFFVDSLVTDFSSLEWVTYAQSVKIWYHKTHKIYLSRRRFINRKAFWNDSHRQATFNKRMWLHQSALRRLLFRAPSDENDNKNAFLKVIICFPKFFTTCQLFPLCLELNFCFYNFQ
jgi:hypothetical protein